MEYNTLRIYKWISEGFKEGVLLDKTDWDYLSTHFKIPYEILVKYKDKLNWKLYLSENKYITIKELLIIKDDMDLLEYYLMNKQPSDDVLFLFNRELRKSNAWWIYSDRLIPGMAGIVLKEK